MKVLKHGKKRTIAKSGGGCLIWICFGNNKPKESK